MPAEERPAADGIAAAGDVALRVILQRPGSMRVLRLMQHFAFGAGERLWISDPYFLSTPLLDRSLMDAARDAVDVRVLLPANNDHVLIGMLMRARYRRLLESGVRIFEHDGPMMHAKTSVADGARSRVGSTNLNIASLAMCWEIDLLVEDPRFGARMERMFEQDFGNSREVGLARAVPRDGTRSNGRPPTAGSIAPVARDPVHEAREEDVALRKECAPVPGQELIVRAATSAAVVGASLLGARFPRLVAWPLAAVGLVLGGPNLLRNAGRIARRARAGNAAER